MARPIAETPTLYGKDALRFTENMMKVERMTREQRRANYKALCRRVEEFERKFNTTLDF